MGMKEKIASAKKSSWVTEGFSESEVKTIVELARISAKIERRRLELGMTQQEFAEYMDVSQGMVSKWESREYNFTIRSLNEICGKLELNLSLSIEAPHIKAPYSISDWKVEKMSKRKDKAWAKRLDFKEGIA